VPPEGEVPTVLPVLEELAPGAAPVVAPEPTDDDPLALGDAELPDISLELRVLEVPMLVLEPELMPVEELDLVPPSIEPQADSARAEAKGISHLIIRFS
jgi:hypothetical protein